jgi:hypothetical protein
MLRIASVLTIRDGGGRMDLDDDNRRNAKEAMVELHAEATAR